MPEVVSSVDELRTIYREPSAGALRKQIDRLEQHCRTFIAHAPFMVLATADADGRCDVSPKGGPAGFVRVIDDNRLAFGDLAGNNRLDSFQNIVANCGVALLFMIPGLDETLRVNGRAHITTDPAVLDSCALDDLRPRVAVVVEVEEAYIHCAKAFRRGDVWRPDRWPDRSDMASAACMLRDHSKAEGVSVEDVQARLDDGYAKTLWQAGGER